MCMVLLVLVLFVSLFVWLAGWLVGYPTILNSSPGGQGAGQRRQHLRGQQDEQRRLEAEGPKGQDMPGSLKGKRSRLAMKMWV